MIYEYFIKNVSTDKPIYYRSNKLNDVGLDFRLNDGPDISEQVFYG